MVNYQKYFTILERDYHTGINMKGKLPTLQQTFETLQAKKEAIDTVDRLIERNLELEEIFQVLQPLLYSLSVAIYGDDAEPVSLAKLVEDSVNLINGREGTIQ